MNWRRWHWLDDGVLPLCLVTIRLCWIAPWLYFLHRWLTPAEPLPWMPLWAIPLFMLGGAYVARAALARSATLRRARIGAVAVGLLAMLGLLWWQYYRGGFAPWDVAWIGHLGFALSHPESEPLPLMTLLIAAGLWLRGVLDGRYRLTHDQIWQGVITAFVSLALLLLVSQVDPQGPPPNTSRWLLLMIGTGLTALALSSLQLSTITGRWEEGAESQLPLNRYWLVSVGAVIAAMLVVGLALGAVVSPASVAQALSWVTVVLDWIGTLLGYVLLAVAYVIFLVLTPLYEWIRSRLAETPRPEPLQIQGLEEMLDPMRQPSTSAVPELVSETARWTGLGAVLVVVIVVTALALRYFRQRQQDEPEEVRETIFTRSLLAEQLSSLWRDLLGRLRDASQGPISPFLPLDDEQETRRAIRARYQSLLALAQAQGYARLRGQTAAEYISLLAERFPTVRGAWATVIEEYTAARYGQPAPSQPQVERMQQVYEELQAVLAAEGAADGSAVEGEQRP